MTKAKLGKAYVLTWQFVILLTSLLTTLCYAQDCSYDNTKAVMRADALRAIVLNIKGNQSCQKYNLSLTLRYQETPSKSLYYKKYSAYELFGFSLYRLTPKQLKAMLDKMTKEFLKPTTVDALQKIPTCTYYVPDSYISTLKLKKARLHPIYASDSSKVYIGYIDEIDKYTEVARCRNVRGVTSDMEGIAADPGGEQVFSAAYKFKAFPHLNKGLAKETLSTYEGWSELSKYENKLCHPYTSAPHILTMNTEDLCMLLPKHCDTTGKLKVSTLYCDETQRDDCFVKGKWQKKNPIYDFAKDIDFRVTSKQTLFTDGIKILEACVYWD